MKRKLTIIALNLFVSIAINAQPTTELFVGSGDNSLVIKGGEIFKISDLTFTPPNGTDLNLTGAGELTKTTTVSNGLTNKPYVARVFKFASAKTFTGSMTFDYTNATIPNGMDENSLIIHYYDGTNWSTSTNPSRNTTTKTVSGGFTSAPLSEIVLSSEITLPVTWLDFTAQRQANQVLLQWSTASEINTQDFVVQHSLNAADWASLGSIDAAGNSNITNRYSYLHTSPVKGSNTINYYRILQRDLDGKFSFSKILSLRFEDGREEVLVYPNPAVHTLTMYLPTTQHVRLVNQQGALIWQGQMQAGRNQLQVSQLAKGMYYLITADGTHPVVIQ